MRNDAGLTPEEARRISVRLMKEQAALGLRVAAVFVLLLLGLPLANLLAPETMGAKIGGFTPTWFILGIFFFPITWILSTYFVRESDKIEARHAQEMTAGEPMGDRGGHH